MSNTIDSPNFLTFPIVFDPFSSYKNVDKNDKSSLLLSKREEKFRENHKSEISNNAQIFTSMVCHQVKFDNPFTEIAADKTDNSVDKNGRILTEEKHPLGKLIFSLEMYYRDCLK